MTEPKRPPGISRLCVSASLAALLVVALFWSYWPTLVGLERRWAHDPRYSHGYLVPAFALYFLWSRLRGGAWPFEPNWSALSLVAAGVAVRALGQYYFLTWFDAISLICSLAGACALVSGWSALRRAWPAFVFLILMVPLPYRVEVLLGLPLQRIATLASTYALQLFGLPAFRSGDTILIGDFQIGVVEACNGMGLAYMFLACAVAAVLLIRVSPAEGTLLIASALPIALIANVVRIVATGVLHVSMGNRMADAVYHDLAGWFMMPLALVSLYLESRLISRLWIKTGDADSPPTDSQEDAMPVDSRNRLLFLRPLLLPLVAAIILVVSAGVVHGQRTDRWTKSREFILAKSRLDRIPMAIGDWKGKSESMDPRAILSAEIEAYLMRRYENSQTGRVVSVLLVCGRPGPVSVHTPDICYTGAGYHMAQAEPNEWMMPAEQGRSPAEFRRADFENEGSFPPDRLRIYWAWNATGAWRVPKIPRFAFAPHHVLYKMYVVHRTARGLEPADEDNYTEFLGQLLPEIETALFDGPTHSPGPH